MDPAPAVYAALDALGTVYERHEHPAVFNAGDARLLTPRRTNVTMVKVQE